MILREELCEIEEGVLWYLYIRFIMIFYLGKKKKEALNWPLEALNRNSISLVVALRCIHHERPRRIKYGEPRNLGVVCTVVFRGHIYHGLMIRVLYTIWSHR